VSLQGPRRGWESDRPLKAFYCRFCNYTAEDYYLPEGWLSVRVRDPQAGPSDHSYTPVGVYCSARCLSEEAAGWAATADAAVSQDGQR
jgi:hypothetical protein